MPDLRVGIDGERRAAGMTWPIHSEGVAQPPQPARRVGQVPSREIRNIVRKRLPDGRVLAFVYELITHATPDMTFVTVELTQAPTLDCGCTPVDPDDVTVCSACLRLVCTRRHAASCSLCGHVHGSCCLLKQRLAGGIVCKECAFQATSPAWKKLLRWTLRGFVRVFRRQRNDEVRA